MQAFTNRKNDSKYINKDNISLFARTNEKFLKDEIQGIIVELPGLGGGSCLGGSPDRGDYDSERAKRYAAKGILLAYMFPGPWSWGNIGAVRTTDAVVDAIKDKYSLSSPSIVVCGGSMGGLGALVYSAYTKHPLKGVAAACPCIDVPACFDTHPDFPRTFLSAISCYDMPFDDALKTISPIHIKDRLQKVPYFICSDGADELFPESQCVNFVNVLLSDGFDVTYRPQPDLLHGDFIPGIREELHAFMWDKLIKS